MRIPPLIFPRQDCAAGQQYYVCATPAFRGCCSNDPCGSSCKDGNGSGTGTTSASSAASATSTKASSATISSASKTASATTNARTTSRSSPSATSSILPDNTQATPSNTPAPSHKSSTGLIAGLVILGVIILILIAILVLRRRRRNTKNQEPSTASKKRVSSLFSRMSLTSPLLGSKTSTSPHTPLTSPPPAYHDEKDHTPVLDSTPIHELPVTTTEERSPSELPASSPQRVVRFDPARLHAMAFADAGAERDEVGALAPNFAVRDRAVRADRGSGVRAETKGAVDGLGIRDG